MVNPDFRSMKINARREACLRGVIKNEKGPHDHLSRLYVMIFTFAWRAAFESWFTDLLGW